DSLGNEVKETGRFESGWFEGAPEYEVTVISLSDQSETDFSRLPWKCASQDFYGAAGDDSFRYFDDDNVASAFDWNTMLLTSEGVGIFNATPNPSMPRHPVMVIVSENDDT